MSTAGGILSVTTLLLCAAVPAGAQDPHHPGPSATAAPQMPGGQPAMTGGMAQGSGMMRMMDPNGMMGASEVMAGMMPMMGMPRHVDGWLAFLRTELRITEAQAAVWGDFADAIHANAARMGEGHASMTHPDAASPNLPERLLAHEQMMAGRLTAMRRMREAIEPLYVVLSDAQKKMANELLSPRGMM
jgi:LTXXQ motif family protein